MKDSNGFEIIMERVEYVLQLGWIGDSEGRTWAKGLKEEHIFPTLEAAKAARDAHPDLMIDRWGSWRTKYDHGQVQILHRLVEIKELS